MILIWQNLAILARPDRAAVRMVNLSGEPPVLQPVDGPEGAVLLDDGEENFRRRVQHLRAESDDAATDVEFADFVDDLQQARARRIRSGHFKRGDDETPREISFQRDEIRRQAGVKRPLGGLIIGNHFPGDVPWKRHHLGDDDPFAGRA
jgi:hypothetical protein